MANPDYSALPSLTDPAKIFDLTGRAGVITGGGGKMGRQFAAVLARAGADVVLADLDPKRAAGAAAEASAAAEKEIRGLECDVADREGVRAFFARASESLGRLDFFISNVMAKPEGYYRPFESYPAEAWRATVDANLSGAFFCCQEAAGLMKSGGGGSVVLTSSIYGVVAADQSVYSDCSPAANPYGGEDPQNLPTVYGATKGGLIAMTRHLATLLAAEGIRVNAMSPGGVYDGQEEAFHREYLRRTPMGRMATWSDFNGAILFLVSDASRYMTGANLVIDGGWTAW